MKINSKVLSNLLNAKYGLKFGEFNNTTVTERNKLLDKSAWFIQALKSLWIYNLSLKNT